jgi:YVTN family beta-propeller protein
VVRSVALEKTPRDAEFSSDGKAFYFTQAGVRAVQVLDPATDKIVAQVPTGVSPHYVNVFGGMSLGVVTVQGPGEVLLFDPATNQPTRSVTVGKQPHWIDASGDGKTLYVTNEGSNELAVVDVATGKTTMIAVGQGPRKVVAQKAGAAMSGAGPKISIADFAFGPQTLTIRAGESITWSNDDGSPHTITFKDGSAGAKSLSPGQSFSRVFDKPGTYEYICSFHPYMTARVVVKPT